MAFDKGYLLGLSYVELKELYDTQVELIQENQGRLSEIKAELEALIEDKKAMSIKLVEFLQRRLTRMNAKKEALLKSKRGNLVPETEKLQSAMKGLKAVMMLNDAYKEEDIISEDAPGM